PRSARAQTKQRPTCLRNCSNRRTRFVSIIAAIRVLRKNPAAVNWLALCTLGFQDRFSLGAMPPPLALLRFTLGVSLPVSITRFVHRLAAALYRKIWLRCLSSPLGANTASGRFLVSAPAQD